MYDMYICSTYTKKKIRNWSFYFYFLLFQIQAFPSITQIHWALENHFHHSPLLFSFSFSISFTLMYHHSSSVMHFSHWPYATHTHIIYLAWLVEGVIKRVRLFVQTFIHTYIHACSFIENLSVQLSLA